MVVAWAKRLRGTEFVSPGTESARKVASKRAACSQGGLGSNPACTKHTYSLAAHCVFRFVRRNYTSISVRNGSLRPMSSAGSLLLASPASKSHSRNACSSVPGRLGANPARRQAYAPPALRLCSWVTSQWGQWLRSPTAEVTLVSAQSTNAVMTIDWT